MYSQHDEERHILKAVEGIKAGRFLDIGAWHAKQFSNTRALYERGWSGILIEPSPEPFAGLLKEYGNDPRITLIHAAAGFERNCVRLHASADAVTTSSDEVYEKWKQSVAFDGVFYSPILTLEDLFNQFGGGYDFVNFDAEGISVDLFSRYIGLGQRPRCICVEHDDRIVECAQHAQTAGYRQIYLNGTNVVFAQ